MERHIHEQNLAHYRRLLAESDRNPERNEVQHNWVLKLLTDEEAEGAKPRRLLHLFCFRRHDHRVSFHLDG
jgi:hypothetical protein